MYNTIQDVVPEINSNDSAIHHYSPDTEHPAESGAARWAVESELENASMNSIKPSEAGLMAALDMLEASGAEFNASIALEEAVELIGGAP